MSLRSRRILRLAILCVACALSRASDGASPNVKFTVGEVEDGLVVFNAAVTRGVAPQELVIPSEFDDMTAVVWRSEDPNEAPPKSLQGKKVVAVGGFTEESLEALLNGGRNSRSTSWAGARRIVVPQGVERIQAHAFENCNSLAQIVLPTGLLAIEPYAFAGCESLTNVVVPESCEIIGDAAFENCVKLKSVELPTTLDSIQDFVFSQCDSLVEVRMPSSLESIGENAFIGCDSLVSADIPQGVEYVGAGAFRQCVRLREVKIPASVGFIDGFDYDPEAIFPTYPPFAECPALKSIDVDPKNQNYASVDGVLFTKDKDAVLHYPPGKMETEYVIPKSATQIASRAFEGVYSLKRVVLHDAIEEIGAYAFSGCGDVEEITLPKRLSTLGEGAFARCSSLEKIVVPKGVKEIKSKTFFYCRALREVELPEKLSAIGDSVFAWCASLEKINLPKGVKAIERQTFYRCGALKEISLPASIQAIDDDAFRACNAALIVQQDSFPHQWAAETNHPFKIAADDPNAKATPPQNPR